MIEKFKNTNYRIVGQLINREFGLISSKSFLLRIDPQIIPKDIMTLDMICFEVGRIDLY